MKKSEFLIQATLRILDGRPAPLQFPDVDAGRVVALAYNSLRQLEETGVVFDDDLVPETLRKQKKR